MKLKQFLFMPEGNDWTVYQAYTAESVYTLNCCWYSPSHRIAVMDIETGETSVFSRELDSNGNFKVLKKEDFMND